MSLLGLDIGTTGSKATLFSVEGETLAFAYQEYPVENPKPGIFELDPRIVWQAVKKIIHDACAKAGDEVQAICISSLGEAFVCLDRSGAELGTSAIYMDKRGGDECAELIAKLGDMEIMRTTGHSPQLMYSICKLMWLKRHEPKIYNDTRYIHFFGDYILHKMGGEHITDYSLAARSMAFDIVNKRWDEKILAAAEISPKIFPDVKVAGTFIGNVDQNVADELGISRKAKLILGAHDQIMCALGAGVNNCGQAVNSIGTVDCVTPVFDKPKFSQGMLNCNYACIPYIFDNTYVTYAFSMTGGSLLKWFRNNFARLDKEQAQLQGEDIYAILDRDMPKQPTDLFVLPHFAGSQGLHTDVMAKGAIINLDFNSGREDIYRACMEGETFETKLGIETLKKEGITINELRTVGGGAKSAEFMQIRADILEKQIVTMECEEAGTLGAGILAGVMTGAYKTVHDASEKFIKTKAVFEPIVKNSVYYRSRFEKYIQLYELMKQVR